MTNKSPFWQKKFKCSMCGSEFNAMRVFSNVTVVKDRDLFMRAKYQGIDPNFYYLVSCPDCYFTSFESDFESIGSKIDSENLAMFRKALKNANKILTLNLGEERNLNDAIDSHSLAALTYFFYKDAFKIAQIFLKMGWFYLDKGLTDKAAIAYSKALRNFEYAYENYEKDIPQDAIMFFIASINIQLNHFSDGFRWLERIVAKYRNSNSYYYQAARKLWEEFRKSK